MSSEISLKTPFMIQKFDSIDDFIKTIIKYTKVQFRYHCIFGIRKESQTVYC